MTKRIIFFSLIVFSALTLSACDRLDQAKTELLKQGTTPTSEISPGPTVTDDQLQKELESSTGPNIDQDLNDLEKALQ